MSKSTSKCQVRGPFSADKISRTKRHDFDSRGYRKIPRSKSSSAQHLSVNPISKQKQHQGDEIDNEIWQVMNHSRDSTMLYQYLTDLL